MAGNIALVNSRMEIVSQERAATDMRKMTLMFTKPSGGGLPTRTFKDRLTLGSGPDRIELYYLGAGHCHADTFVVIPALRILLTGDAFGGKYLPALVRPNGGNGVAYPETLTKALALTREVDTLITSRGGLAKPKDLEVHRDFMRDFLESARQAKKAGRTAAEAAKAWRVPPRYVGYTRREVGVGRHGVDLPTAAIVGRRDRVKPSKFRSNVGATTPKHQGRPGTIRDQKTKPGTTSDNLVRSAKPPSPVQIRAAPPFSGSVPDTWVTVYSGDMGNTFGPKGLSIGSSRHVSSSK